MEWITIATSIITVSEHIVKYFPRIYNRIRQKRKKPIQWKPYNKDESQIIQEKYQPVFKQQSFSSSYDLRPSIIALQNTCPALTFMEQFKRAAQRGELI